MFNFNVNLQSLLDIPAHVFWKNNDGVYLGLNQSCAKSYLLESPQEMIYKNDFLLLDRIANIDEISEWRKNDLKVITEKKLIICDESFTQKGKTRDALTYKLPFFDCLGNSIGIFGVGFYKSQLKENKKLLHNIDFLFKIAAPFILTNPKYDKLLNNSKYGLTKKELTILYQLINKHTAKEIAIPLGCSYRTVEKHIEHIKAKLNCKTTSELCDRILDGDLIV